MMEIPDMMEIPNSLEIMKEESTIDEKEEDYCGLKA